MFASPLISVVVAAHDLQGSLESCLASILTQSFTDVEVIVVMDGSPECPLAPVDAWAKRDERLSVVRLPGAAGIGRIRNAGAEQARGDYLLFLDADHIVKGATLQAMADRLDATEDPDVLLFGHTRLHRGRSWPGAAGEILAQQGQAPFAALDQPELFGAPVHAWDRLVSRELWTKHQLAFPEGLYEEIPVGHRALLAAERVAVLKWECVQLGRKLTQHPLGSPEGTQFDLFDRYEQSFTLLESHPAAAAQLFTRMIRHYLFVLNLKAGLARSDRQRFFQRASEHYRRYAPEGFERPEGREGVKFQLVAGGTYSAFEAAKLPALARVVARVR